jgi:hypothetical protein
MEMRQAILNGFRVVRHALEPAFVQERFLPIGKLEQTPFQRRRAKVGDEDFHAQGLQGFIVGACTM